MVNDLLFNSRVLGAMIEHACLSDEEELVLRCWANGLSIVETGMRHHMSDSKVEKIRHRLRLKYDSIQQYTDLPIRKK